MTLSLKNDAFSNDIATGYGGALAVYSGADPASATISDTSFTGDSSQGGYFNGGGAIADFGGTITIANSTFKDDSASGYGGATGGAIYTTAGPYAAGAVTVSNGLFQGDTAESVQQAQGGAIEAEFGGAFAVAGSTFLGNTATSGGNSFGGAIYLNGNSFGAATPASTIQNSVFANNLAVSTKSGFNPQVYGGAVSQEEGAGDLGLGVHGQRRDGSAVRPHVVRGRRVRRRDRKSGGDDDVGRQSVDRQPRP